MRVRPRQQLLEIWEATARRSWRDGQWVPGGRFGSHSISDAEQILCLLLPATQLATFRLDRPDQTDERMEQALRGIGSAMDIPRTMVRILADYYERYTEDGTPIFADGGDLRADGVPVVDSFAVSVTLSLATLGFARVFRRSVTRDDVRQRIADLEAAAGMRLSAAMVGLLRSFSVNVFPIDSPEGERLCRTVNQDGLPRRVVVSRLRRELRQTIAAFREVLIDSGQPDDLDSPDRLFECGWAWGVVEAAPGAAQDRPSLYFTAVALDAIEDLFSERTRVLGLLDEEQQRLARALQLRSDLTRSYWTTVATFGTRWPLEDVPWRTTDGDESDYFTLRLSSLALRGGDVEPARVGRVLLTLAERARITSRAVRNDPNIGLHAPGVQLRLTGHDGTAYGVWPVPEFAALLLARTAEVALLLDDPAERARMLDLADEIWDHLEARRIDHGDGRGLWDRPERIFESLPATPPGPSWYYTARVVAALVTVARVIDQPPARNAVLADHAGDLIREAEQLLDRELLHGGAEGAPRLAEVLRLTELTLGRARQILAERPGTAAALAADSLRELDRIAAARTGVETEG